MSALPFKDEILLRQEDLVLFPLPTAWTRWKRVYSKIPQYRVASGHLKSDLV